VWRDQYPYTASQTTITTMLPDWVFSGGRDNAREILKDEQRMKKLMEDMRKSHEVSRGRTDLSYAVISSSSSHPQYVGKNIKQIAQIRKLKEKKGEDVELLGLTEDQWPAVTMEDQYRVVIEIAATGNASCVYHTMSEDEVKDIMRHPLVSIASDSGVRRFNSGQPHPRGYGTNARVLGRYVRELQLITLEDAIRKMTSMPATAFRFSDRGLLRPGYVADIVVFDPDKIIDKATFEQPHQYSVGFGYVLVNGEIVLENDELTGAMPGKPVRRE
jgi:N-acyl-D-amino-acid deacylase